ncbi:Uncharacterized protein FWK35_00003165 [Aphis craccivora]|uniref:Uncharacterized protein n=1 Tax=Aphis craccivora TaxID=307492 RepID=A0A6G0ZKX4_APHCR|nr:Uncharacterized protein FWK35_00003165 [Aphis craccivora]
MWVGVCVYNIHRYILNIYMTSGATVYAIPRDFLVFPIQSLYYTPPRVRPSHNSRRLLSRAQVLNTCNSAAADIACVFHMMSV